MNEQELENALRGIRENIELNAVDFHTFRMEDFYVDGRPVTIATRPSISIEDLKLEVEKPKVELKIEEPKKERYKYDDNRRKILYPIAVLQEEVAVDIKEEGNEVIESGFIRLHIREQQKNFCFTCYENSDGTLSSEYTMNTRCRIRICSSHHLEKYFSKDDIEVYLKGDSDFHETKYIDVPLGYYERFKKALDFLEIIVEEDVEGKIKMNETDTEAKTKYLFEETPTEKDIEEMISQVDLKTFISIIRARLIQERNTDKIETLTDEWAKEYLQQWAKSKFRFYQILGRKLTISTEIELERTEQECREKMRELAERFPLYYHVLTSSSAEVLLKNDIGTKTQGRIPSVFFYDSRVRNHLQFTKLMSLYGNKELDTEISKFYQDKGMGHLYISINPIDFLTVSINRSGWHSCHNLFEGAFRNASLSYMNDTTSLVAYRSEANVEYIVNSKKFEWNTKSWRQMIYVSEENSTMIFSRQYPYESEPITKTIRGMMEAQISEYYKGSNQWKVASNKDKYGIVVERKNGAHLYNDVANGFNHKVVIAKDDNNLKSHKIIIGDKARKIINKDDYIRTDDGSIW